MAASWRSVRILKVTFLVKDPHSHSSIALLPSCHLPIHADTTFTFNYTLLLSSTQGEKVSDECYQPSGTNMALEILAMQRRGHHTTAKSHAQRPTTNDPRPTAPPL